MVDQRRLGGYIYLGLDMAGSAWVRHNEPGAESREIAGLDPRSLFGLVRGQAVELVVDYAPQDARVKIPTFIAIEAERA